MKKETNGFLPMVGDADNDQTFRTLRKQGIKKGFISNTKGERFVFYLDGKNDSTPMARQVKSFLEEKLFVLLIFFK